MAEVFSANQILGKTFWAKKKLIAYYGSPGSTRTFPIEKGSNVGIVYSYATPTKDKTQLWWMFYERNDTKNGKAFWVKHEQDAFDRQAIKDEGAKTVKEVTEEKKEKEDRENESTMEFLVKKYGPKVALTAGGIYLGGVLFKTFFGGNKNG